MRQPGRGYASPGPYQWRLPWVWSAYSFAYSQEERELLSSWLVLPATQDGVRQDA
jgi:hypothetical protein